MVDRAGLWATWLASRFGTCILGLYLQENSCAAHYPFYVTFFLQESCCSVNCFQILQTCKY
jgi:hypothetical protein